MFAEQGPARPAWQNIAIKGVWRLNIQRKGDISKNLCSYSIWDIYGVCLMDPPFRRVITGIIQRLSALSAAKELLNSSGELITILASVRKTTRRD